MQVINAQTTLIDRQWCFEQDKLTEIEVERLHREGEITTAQENEESEAINRTRRLIKLRPLPRKKVESKAVILKRLNKGGDILSVGNIVPIEIRCSIIKVTLRHMKQLHAAKMEQYLQYKEKYNREVGGRQRRRALLAGFSGNGIAGRLVGELDEGEEVANEVAKVQPSEREIFLGNMPSPTPLYVPQRPMFTAILKKRALWKMMEKGAHFVESVRKEWEPSNMVIGNLPKLDRIGKALAICNSNGVRPIINYVSSNNRKLSDDLYYCDYWGFLLLLQ